MARGSQKAPGQREAAHTPARRHCRRTPPASLGQSRKELCLRFAKRQENASRPLRRPKPADRVPLHVWPGVAGGLPQLLLQHGSHGRRTCASGATKRGVSLSYVPFPRSLLPFGVVKEGEQLGIDLVFQGRPHPCGPPGTILSFAPFTSLAEGSAESLTQHSPAFRHEGRELALKQLSCTAAPAVSDRR